MFDPKKAKANKDQEKEKAKIINQLKEWSLSIIPLDCQVDLDLDVREVICGDPTCAPVDTVFTLIWPNGGKGLFAIQMAPFEISHDDLIQHFPDADILQQWKEGIKAVWPRRPELRYTISDRVECRIGPHPVKGWAPGRIVKLYYSEPDWPPNMVAPYQILLHDGRLIFAPQDTDQVIRLRPPPAPDAPSSPEINYADYADDYDDEDEDDMEEEEEDGEDDETNKETQSSSTTNQGSSSGRHIGR